MYKSKYLFPLLLLPVLGAIFVIGCANLPSSEITFHGHSGDQYSDPFFLLPGTVRIEWTPDSGTIVQHIAFQRDHSSNNPVGYPPLFEFRPRTPWDPGSPWDNDGSKAGSDEVTISEPSSYIITASATGDFTVKISRISSNDMGASGTSNTGNTAAFASVVKARVQAIPRGWDSEAGNDGIVVYPELLDANDRAVQWSGPPLTVDIEIWAIRLDSNFEEHKGQLIYRGTGTIKNWKDGNFLLEGAIRVPYKQMSIPSDASYGRTYARVHTPDGKIYEGVCEVTELPA